MKRVFVGGLVALLLEGCMSFGYYGSYVPPDDATQFRYYRDKKMFHAQVVDYSCEKPCKIVIDEYQKDFSSGEFAPAAIWTLKNYGDKVPYEVSRASAIDGHTIFLKERDLDNQAIPMDTLRARFHFK
jgi:hypothetical protein